MRRCALVLVACGTRTAPPAAVDNRGGEATAPAIELTVEATRSGHAAIVHNAGAALVRLRRDIVVQRIGDAEPIVTAGLYLRSECRADPPACVDLAPGATLRAEPWDDEIGDAQCDCDKCAAAPAGAYTFTMTPCDGGAPVTSAPFDVRASQ